MVLMILTVLRIAVFRILKKYKKNINKLNKDKILILNENQIKPIKVFN